jgi:hypothetical protein
MLIAAWVVGLLAIPTGIFVALGHPLDKSLEAGFVVAIALALILFGALSSPDRD